MDKKNYKLIVVIGLFIVGLIFFYKQEFDNNNKILLPEPVSRQDILEKLVKDSVTTTDGLADDEPINTNTTSSFSKSTSEIPNNINLNVPFAVQAPKANWTMPYKEACEEATLIMVNGYLNGVINYESDDLVKQIDDLVNYQLEVYGEHRDLTILETAKIAQDYFKVNYRVLDDLDIDKIKFELSQGNPVIIPAAGRLLGNPNFRGEGPLYHMLVIKGFQDNFFITNDPGTRNGADYLYQIDKLLAAIADWTGESPTGNKVGLVLYK